MWVSGVSLNGFDHLGDTIYQFRTFTHWSAEIAWEDEVYEYVFDLKACKNVVQKTEL